MEYIGLLFPHQLFENNPLINKCKHVYLVEENLFFKQYAFHKQKLLFHRASMKYYASFLRQKGLNTSYIDSNQDIADIRKLIPYLSSKGVKAIHAIDVTDDWLEERLKTGCNKSNIHLEIYESPMFINSTDMLQPFFSGKKAYRQTSFYIDQRKKWQLLMEKNGKPLGGKWTYDDQNRMKYPNSKSVPEISWPSNNAFTREAFQYVQNNFSDHYGYISDDYLYPVTHTDANTWFETFLEQRFEDFGKYQDSMVSGELVLHHSLLSPLMNSGLLTPAEIVNKSVSYATEHNIPLNSLEGFVRQIVGWREFLRGIYLFAGKEQRTANFWGFQKKIPHKFWEAKTGVVPVDDVIEKVLKTGYAHHIERLMILGNFMLLCEFNPDEVYKWFMELFIDAYDWVMVPNVYGMSQFADRGLLATKPYISSSNYILKMSNYQKGDWQFIWDGLFWRFLNENRSYIQKNPRLNMLIKNFDKMTHEKQNTYILNAEKFLTTL